MARRATALLTPGGALSVRSSSLKKLKKKVAKGTVSEGADGEATQQLALRAIEVANAVGLTEGDAAGGADGAKDDAAEAPEQAVTAAAPADTPVAKATVAQKRSAEGSGTPASSTSAKKKKTRKEPK